MSTILVVDQLADVRSTFREALEAEGFLALEAADRDDILRFLEVHRVDLVILGLLSQPSNWIDLTAEIRIKRNIPIVIVGGNNSPEDRVVGLENGADDYLVRPFHMRELILRLRNVLKRYARSAADVHSQEEPQQYIFEDFVLDTYRRELRTNGTAVELTDFEYRLLSFFVANATRVLSRDEISRTLSGHDWSPLDRTIDGHVARLRHKIEVRVEQPRLIKSVRGVGYVFVSGVGRSL